MGTSVHTLSDSEFYRAFAGRVREHLAATEHGRAADLTERPAIQAPAGPGHFPWCDSHRTDVCDQGTRLTEHESASVGLAAPAGMDAATGGLLTAFLYSSENFVRPETFLSLNCGGNGVLLDAAETDQVIEDLVAFVAELRALRAQMGGAR